MFILLMIICNHPTALRRGNSITSYWSFCPYRANKLAHQTQGDALG